MQPMSCRYLTQRLTDSRQNPGHRMPHPRKPKLDSRNRVAGCFCACTPYSDSTFAQQVSLSSPPCREHTLFSQHELMILSTLVTLAHSTALSICTLSSPASPDHSMSSLITARRPLYVVPCDPYVPHTAADTRPLSVPGSIHHVPCTPHCALHASGPLLSPLSSSGGAASYSALALTGDTPCLILAAICTPSFQPATAPTPLALLPLSSLRPVSLAMALFHFRPASPPFPETSRCAVCVSYPR